MEQPRYSWQLLRAGPLLLDAGSMFGVIPRVVWSRNVATDAQGRMTVAHNCLLLQRKYSDAHIPEDTCDDPQRIVIEAGSGDKFDAKNRAIFGLGNQTVETAVESAGVRCDQIDAVIVSHLHFDHAGGLTRLARPGETPDWVDEKAGLAIRRTFPKAPIYVQRREFEDAATNRSHMTRTYLRENLEPIRQQIHPVNAPLPFPDNYIPDRDELPSTDVAQRSIEILPGITVFRVPGHTWGQQAICFNDDRGRTVVFTPDLVPTAHHVGAAYNMAYDVAPYISTVTRRWFFSEAVCGNWLLVLDHEPGNPCQRVKADGKGWYAVEGEGSGFGV